MTLLTTRATERRRAYQGLSRIRPTIWMGVVGVVDLKIVRQAGFKIVGRIEIPALEKTSREDAKPQFHLVEPRAVFGVKWKTCLCVGSLRKARRCPPRRSSFAT